jgi:hypothetical protein
VVGSKLRACITGASTTASMTWTDFHYYSQQRGMHEENMADRDRNGTTARGPHLSRLSDDDIREIRRRCDAGEKHHLVAHSYRLRGSAVANIAARKTFQNVM